MKKILIFVLIFSLLLPVSAFADTRTELIGAWMGLRESFLGELTYFLVRLYDDNTALYETDSFSFSDDEGFRVVKNGTWELKDDGVHVYTPNIWDSNKTEDFLLELTNAHYLAHKLVSSYIIFTKLPDCRPISETHIVDSWD